jgi:hypothetical protein
MGCAASQSAQEAHFARAVELLREGKLLDAYRAFDRAASKSRHAANFGTLESRYTDATPQPSTAATSAASSGKSLTQIQLTDRIVVRGATPSGPPMDKRLSTDDDPLDATWATHSPLNSKPRLFDVAPASSSATAAELVQMRSVSSEELDLLTDHADSASTAGSPTSLVGGHDGFGAIRTFDDGALCIGLSLPPHELPGMTEAIALRFRIADALLEAGHTHVAESELLVVRSYTKRLLDAHDLPPRLPFPVLELRRLFTETSIRLARVAVIELQNDSTSSATLASTRHTDARARRLLAVGAFHARTALESCQRFYGARSPTAVAILLLEADLLAAASVFGRAILAVQRALGIATTLAPLQRPSPALLDKLDRLKKLRNDAALAKQQQRRHSLKAPEGPPKRVRRPSEADRNLCVSVDNV